jgi:hypothetical protein
MKVVVNKDINREMQRELGKLEEQRTRESRIMSMMR